MRRTPRHANARPLTGVLRRRTMAAEPHGGPAEGECSGRSNRLRDSFVIVWMRSGSVVCFIASLLPLISQRKAPLYAQEALPMVCNPDVVVYHICLVGSSRVGTVSPTAGRTG